MIDSHYVAEILDWPIPLLYFTDRRGDSQNIQEPIA